MERAINWFELFVTDLPRAQKFYEQALGITLKTQDFMGEPHALFAGGALVLRKGRAPSTEGSVVYMNCNGKLDAVLARIEQAGGRVVLPKTSIGPQGFTAMMLDSEGNQVGLHEALG